MRHLEKYWLVKSARSISREQLKEIIAEIAEAKKMYMPRRGRPVAAEPLHIKYGPKVHFGRGRYGTHVAREGADGTEHLYKDRVFIGDAQGGYGRKLYPDELEMVQDLIKSKSASEIPKGLTRDQIIEYLNALNHPGVGIGGGAAMVLRGLREDTSDIDADALTDVFEEIHSKYGDPEIETTEMGTRMFNVPGTPIDLHEGEPQGEDIEGIMGPVETPEQLLAFYERLNRPKDQQWLDVLRHYVKSGG